jgi:hypothetical protein
MILTGTLICVFGIFFKILRVEMVSENSKFVKKFMNKEKVQFPKNCNERIQNDSLDLGTPLKTFEDEVQEIKFVDVILFLETNSFT